LLLLLKRWFVDVVVVVWFDCRSLIVVGWTLVGLEHGCVLRWLVVVGFALVVAFVAGWLIAVGRLRLVGTLVWLLLVGWLVGLG